MSGFDVYLVRHGQSLSNVQGRLCGQPPGPGLTDLGRRQAEAAATRLMGGFLTAPVLVVTSPLLRTWQTADALSRKVGRPPVIARELRETAFGRWEGRTDEELRAQPEYRAWAADPLRNPAWVEGVDAAGERVRTYLAGLARSFGRGTVVAYSHQHPILGFVRLCGLDVDEGRIPNAVAVHAVWQDGTWRIDAIDPTASDSDVAAAVRPLGGTRPA